MRATCSTCRKNNISLHPLVKQGCIPKKLANVFTYCPPPETSRCRVKTVECACIVTSEEIRKEEKETEARKKRKKTERSNRNLKFLQLRVRRESLK